MLYQGEYTQFLKKLNAILKKAAVPSLGYLRHGNLKPSYLERVRHARIFLANNLPFKWTVNRPNARIWQSLADGWGNYPASPLLYGQQNNVAAFQ